MKMFFVTSDNIPEGVGFQAYGLTHILWLLAGLVFLGDRLPFLQKALCAQAETGAAGAGRIYFSAGDGEESGADPVG